MKSPAVILPGVAVGLGNAHRRSALTGERLAHPLQRPTEQIEGDLGPQAGAGVTHRRQPDF